MKRSNELPTPVCHVVIYDEGTLAPTHIRIPQLDGSTALIPTLDITELANGLRSLLQCGRGRCRPSQQYAGERNDVGR